jgi:hypothetical protein
VRKSFKVAFPTGAIGVADGTVWTTDPYGDEVTALDLATDRPCTSRWATIQPLSR